MSLVKNIKELADMQGITLRELGIKLGIGENAIYKWEKSSPKVETLQKVAKHFNVTLDSLVAEETYIEDVEEMDEETRAMITDPKAKRYLYLSKKIIDSGVPDDVFETLLDSIDKIKKANR